MPFGLTNTPSTFQSLLIFFDDILVYSSDWNSYLVHLREVFHRLRLHHLFAKLSKYEFGCTTIGYLGHVISGKGVAVDPDKIQAKKEWPIPGTIKALRSFLGLCSYCRRFVTNYSKLAAPLIELLRKDAFVWSETAT